MIFHAHKFVTKVFLMALKWFKTLSLKWAHHSILDSHKAFLEIRDRLSPFQLNVQRKLFDCVKRYGANIRWLQFDNKNIWRGHRKSCIAQTTLRPILLVKQYSSGHLLFYARYLGRCCALVYGSTSAMGVIDFVIGVV